MASYPRPGSMLPCARRDDIGKQIANKMMLRLGTVGNILFRGFPKCFSFSFPLPVEAEGGGRGGSRGKAASKSSLRQSL